jgi:hypothetical protein
VPRPPQGSRHACVFGCPGPLSTRRTEILAIGSAEALVAGKAKVAEMLQLRRKVKRLVGIFLNEGLSSVVSLPPRVQGQNAHVLTRTQRLSGMIYGQGRIGG